GCVRRDRRSGGRDRRTSVPRAAYAVGPMLRAAGPRGSVPPMPTRTAGPRSEAPALPTCTAGTSLGKAFHVHNVANLIRSGAVTVGGAENRVFATDADAFAEAACHAVGVGHARLAVPGLAG